MSAAVQASCGGRVVQQKFWDREVATGNKVCARDVVDEMLAAGRVQPRGNGEARRRKASRGTHAEHDLGRAARDGLGAGPVIARQLLAAHGHALGVIPYVVAERAGEELDLRRQIPARPPRWYSAVGVKTQPSEERRVEGCAHLNCCRRTPVDSAAHRGSSCSRGHNPNPGRRDARR